MRRVKRVGNRQLIVHSSQTIVILDPFCHHLGAFLWLSGKEPACQCRRCGFDPWVEYFPWRKKWLPTPVFLPGKSHGFLLWRSLVGYCPWGPKS